MDTRDKLILDEVLGIIYPDTTPTDKQKELIIKLINLQARKLSSRINIELNGDLEIISQVPSQFDWIIVETVIRRFNKIGAEGMKSETVEGHSITFYDGDELDNYKFYFDKYNNEEIIGTERQGRIRFY